MYYVWVDNYEFKVRTIRDAVTFLDGAGVGDFSGLRRDLRRQGCWENDGERCGVEHRDGRELRDIDYAPF